MQRYVPTAMELAPRDIVSRSIQTEIDEGRGFEHPLGKYIKLDLRHLGEKKILECLPGIRKICIDFIGIDPVHEPIPIMPCQHYSMGGIDTNVRSETEIKGFYAAGECACVSVHGANRLGGNSLLDTIVFGKLASFSIPEYLETTEARPEEHVLTNKQKELEGKIERLTAEGSERPYRIQTDLSTALNTYVGIFRQKNEIEQGLAKIAEIRERYRHVHVSSRVLHMNYELMNALELEYMVEVAHTIALGALLREESRGAHSRKDFPQRNDADWLKHTVARMGDDGLPSISFKEVAITTYQPMERKY